MKIAVTYSENGEVFQHFGRTEQFKIFTIEDGKVVSTEVLDCNGTGHEALAGLLQEQGGISTLICGGLGQGASEALKEAGIEVISGVKGNADLAVDDYLEGDLVSQGVNCEEEHEEEGCGCEGGCGGNCGGGCGGSCGCGGERPIIIPGKNAGKTVSVHYTGTFNDGTKFDSSYDRGQPLQFVSGIGMMIPGFDKAVVDMEVGQVTDIHLMPSEAYGERDPEAILKIEIAKLQGSGELEVGQHVYLYNSLGQPFPVTVIEKDDVNITFDANHEMAGKELNFRIELVSIDD